MRVRIAVLLLVCGVVVLAFDVLRAPPAAEVPAHLDDIDTAGADEADDHAAGHFDDEDDCDHGAHPR